MESLLGTCGIMVGKDGQGKSHELKNKILPAFGKNAVIYDWHGDYARDNVPGKKFPMMEAKQFIEFAANPNLKNHCIVFEEADNFYGSNLSNPLGIDRMKVKWILSQKGEHHNNNCVIFVYHALTQLPDDVKYFYDWFFLYDQEAPYQKVKDRWNGEKIFDAYQMHEEMWNSDKDKIQKPNGDLIKPPLIFSRTKDLPKLQVA